MSRCKGPNITKYDTVCLSVRWVRTRTTEGSPPTEPALSEGIRMHMEPGNQITKLCTSGILEQNCFLVRREHIKMNMVHTSVRSVLLEIFSGRRGRDCVSALSEGIRMHMEPGNQITKTVHQWHSRTEPSHQNMTKQADCEPCGWNCY